MSERKRLAYISSSHPVAPEFTETLINEYGWEVIGPGANCNMTIQQLRAENFRTIMQNRGLHICKTVGPKATVSGVVDPAEFLEDVFPSQILGEKVLTACREILFGILASEEELEQRGYRPIELVWVDLGNELDVFSASLICAAAQNRRAVITNVNDSSQVLFRLRNKEWFNSGELEVQAGRAIAALSQHYANAL